MKIFHLSDLHIGKQLHSYSLAKEQIRIFDIIKEKAMEIRPDVIIIAGDIYDKTSPSGEAFSIFDKFLNSLSCIEPHIPVLIIAGNHDSAERLKFAGEFLERHGIYISVMPPQNDDEYLKRVVLEDEFGRVNFYMLPFTKPGYVRGLSGESEIKTYKDAVETVLKHEEIDYSERNVIISHQFYIPEKGLPETCDSENSILMAGGIENIPAELLKNFDYAALGHIHSAQSVGYNHIRYSGTPLKYSVSEEKHIKGITMITLGRKNTEPVIERIPLLPLHDVRKISGTLEDIIHEAVNYKDDYVSITVTDENEPSNLKDILMQYYERILEIRIDNSRTRSLLNNDSDDTEEINPLSLFMDFYQEMNGITMSEAEEKVIKEVLDVIGEGEKI